MVSALKNAGVFATFLGSATRSDDTSARSLKLRSSLSCVVGWFKYTVGGALHHGDDVVVTDTHMGVVVGVLGGTFVVRWNGKR